MNKNVMLGIGAVVIVGLIIFFVSSSRTPESNMGDTVTPPPAADVLPPPTGSTEPTPLPPATDGPTDTKTFTVTGQNFSFAPATLTVKKGDLVQITFKNASGFHDFRIDAFKVATKQIQGGQEETIEFIADKAGSFEYYCSVGNHRAMGMKGTLVVQ